MSNPEPCFYHTVAQIYDHAFSLIVALELLYSISSFAGFEKTGVKVVS